MATQYRRARASVIGVGGEQLRGRIEQRTPNASVTRLDQGKPKEQPHVRTHLDRAQRYSEKPSAPEEAQSTTLPELEIPVVEGIPQETPTESPEKALDEAEIRAAGWEEQQLRMRYRQEEEEARAHARYGRHTRPYGNDEDTEEDYGNDGYEDDGYADDSDEYKNEYTRMNPPPNSHYFFYYGLNGKNGRDGRDGMPGPTGQRGQPGETLIPVGLQAQLTGGTDVDDGGVVLFNTVPVRQVDFLSYNPATGFFTINRAGYYTASWWVGIEGAPRPVTFAVRLNDGSDNMASSDVTSGQVVGQALLSVGMTPATVTLVNVSGFAVQYQTAPVQASLILTGVAQQ